MANAKRDPARIFRPKYGLRPPAGWKIMTKDTNCVFCHQMACLTTPKGDPAHPGCWERRNQKPRQ